MNATLHGWGVIWEHMLQYMGWKECGKVCYNAWVGKNMGTYHATIHGMEECGKICYNRSVGRNMGMYHATINIWAWGM